jgi:hypothetical protein
MITVFDRAKTVHALGCAANVIGRKSVNTKENSNINITLESEKESDPRLDTYSPYLSVFYINIRDINEGYTKCNLIIFVI